MLLAHGLDLDAEAFTEDAWKATPLWFAIARGRNLLLAEYLLERGCDPNYALWAAAFNDDLEAIDLLVGYGAIVDDPSVPDETPFLSAVKVSHFQPAGRLLDHGADVNVQDPKGMTALHYMLKKQSDKAHFEMLVAHGRAVTSPIGRASPRSTSCARSAIPTSTTWPTGCASRAPPSGEFRHAREPFRFRSVRRVVDRPRPPAELRPPVVRERLLDLRLGVHHERPVLRDGLADRPGLQHQTLDGFVTGYERDRDVGLQQHPGRVVDVVAGDAQAVAFEDIQRAHGLRPAGGSSHSRRRRAASPRSRGPSPVAMPMSSAAAVAVSRLRARRRRR